MIDIKELGYEIIIGAVAVVVFAAGIWVGATISTNHADALREAEVDNALTSSATALNCKDSEIIEAIKGLAENGAHIKGFALQLDMGNTPSRW